VDYAGPVLLKTKPVRKPKLVKAYISVFVCLSVKAVHLEIIVSDLTSEAFLGALRRFTSHCGKPHVMWSDGTNFVGAANELKALFAFL